MSSSTQAELVRYSVHGDVAVLTVDNPPVNALSPGVPEGIVAGVERAIESPGIQAIVLTGAGRTFIAGADIREFGKASGGHARGRLADSLTILENSPKPIVAALHGTTLGGGLETAMACHYRVIAASGKVGQPEIKLGLIPGAGGTQRLPRLAGIAKALEMCAFGEPISAADALASGIVDEIASEHLLDHAIAFARSVVSQPLPRTCDRNDKLHPADPALYSAARDKARKTKRGQFAPLAAIEAIEAAVTLPFAQGIQREAELFEQCRASTQSKALIYAFFGERAVSKIPGISSDIQPFTIEHVAIIGAGTMGGGIAMAFADAGITVRIKEATQEALDRGMKTIQGNYARSLKSGRLTQEAMDERLALITPQLDDTGFDQADMIVEAVFENMAVKQAVFAQLDTIAKPDCVLATNTSSLDIDQIAHVARRPHMVIGLHFFSPANVMKLVEVVPGKATAPQVLATAFAVTKRLNKIGVWAGNTHGFIGNRMMHEYVREAELLVEDGASIEDVNQTLFDFGMAMGPLAMEDLVGIDIMWRIRDQAPSHPTQTHHSHSQSKALVRKPVLMERLFALHRYGQKNGKGWSKYDENRKASSDPEVVALIEATAQEIGITRRAVSPQEIIDRCILALVNEGAKILEEGMALRAVDIDMVYLNGYGFPAWRGGPMFYADTIGLPQVLARIREFEAEHGSALWKPAALLVQLAESGNTFSEYDKSRS